MDLRDSDLKGSKDGLESLQIIAEIKTSQGYTIRYELYDCFKNNDGWNTGLYVGGDPEGMEIIKDGKTVYKKWYSDMRYILIIKELPTPYKNLNLYISADLV